MLNKVSERTMHGVRWLLALGWITLLASAFYDPITPLLTDPTNSASPFSDDIYRYGFGFDGPTFVQCWGVEFQGTCMPVLRSYPMMTRMFWGWMLPIAIITIFVLGHEVWRRICPLYFFSQIPRHLGLQPRFKIDNNPWLIKNHFYLQFALLFLGLNTRIFWINSVYWFYSLFVLAVILAAIATIYLYGGRSWCHYVCPFGAVQTVFTGPRGLLDSEAHKAPPRSLTQSMCRTVDAKTNHEKPACISCKSSCLDIDSEKSYWADLSTPGRKFLQYGYLGLAVGYFLYYYLYSGTFDFYYSGAWFHIPEDIAIAKIWEPGLYFGGHKVPIPLFVTAPITLAIFIVVSFVILLQIERFYAAYLKRKNSNAPYKQMAQHRLFSLVTFVAFNGYFVYGGRPEIIRWPFQVQFVFNALVVLVSAFWLYRTWGRTPDQYTKESLADKLRRQLSKFPFNFAQYLEGRSLDELKADEVYVLAKTLPGLNHERRLQVYKGTLQEALATGSVTSLQSLEMFRNLRQQLDISDEEHYNVLAELGIEDPSLLDPRQQQSRENQLRRESYRQAIELLLLELVEGGTPLRQALQLKERQILALKREYRITPEEEELVLAEIFQSNSILVQAANALQEQLQVLDYRDQAIKALPIASGLMALLRVTVRDKQQLVLTQILRILEILGETPEALEIARSLEGLANDVLRILLLDRRENTDWPERLSPDVLKILQFPVGATRLKEPIHPTAATQTLLELVQEPDALTQATSLYALKESAPQYALTEANRLLNMKPLDDFVREVAEDIVGKPKAPRIQTAMTLIAQVTAAGKDETVVFQKSRILVGRARDNDLVFSDRQLSRYQAVLTLEDGGLKVQNVGNPQGLRVVGHLGPIQELQLNQNAVLTLGGEQGVKLNLRWEQRPVPETERVSDTVDTFRKLLWLFENSFFRGLQAEALIELAHTAQVHHYASGEEICGYGHPVDALRLIASGAAHVLVPRGDRLTTVGLLSANQTIGELTALTQGRHKSTVVASEPTTILAIPVTTLEDILRRDPHLSRNLLLTVSDRLETMLSQASFVT
jgi:hypothetical protein